MQEQARTTLEVIAPSVDEAVAKGLAQLGLPLEAVEVEILDRGGRGLFGLLGHRDARVRLIVKTQLEAQQPAQQPAGQEKQPRRRKPKPARRAEEKPPRRESRSRRPRRKSTSAGREREREAAPSPDAARSGSRAAGADPAVLRVASETVAELLEKMGIQAEVSAHYGEAESGRRPPVMVDITGKDLSILIGRRAERLNALQFIARLIVGKELGRTVTIIIDVEHYRRRREEQLHRMAKRMADQAARTGRRVVMEPMPANERRIVHIALRDDPRVTTESVGREPHRKVTIVPTTR